MQPSIKGILIIVCIVPLVVGCGKKNAAEKIAGETQETQQTSDQNSITESQTETVQGDLEQSVSGALIVAGYKLNVTSLLGIQVCDGEVNIEFNPLFAADGKLFDLPKSPVSCLFGKKFDLGELMGALGGPPPDSDGLPVSVEDDVIGLGQLGFAEFEPHRPMFPSILAADIDDLKKLDVKRRIQMVDTKSGTKTSGTAHLKVTGYEKSYRPEDMDFTFKKVITFEVIHEGFDDVDKVSSFIFERMEMKVSLDPVAVPKIYLQARVGDIAGAAGTSGGLGSVAGGLVKNAKVEMHLEMFQMEGLEAFEDDEDD